MAATLKRLRLSGVGTTATSLTTGSETGPGASKVWNLPRLYLCNTTGSAITVDVALVVSATSYYLVKDKSLAANDTLILENITLINGDAVQVASDTAASLDAYASVMEEDA